MRNIKFRGKAKNSNWVYGNLHINSIADKDDKYYINPNFYIENPNYIEIDGKTLGQYTGLKDKNGTEIFEGDIVENDHIRGIVKFGNPDFKEGSKTSMFYVEVTHTDCEVFTFIGDVYSEFNKFKVVGNICENPELLEAKN